MSSNSSNRTQIIATVLGGIFVLIGAIISSPHWFKHFYPEQYIESEKIPVKITRIEDKESQKTKDTHTGYTNIRLSKIEMCPVNSKIPNYLYFEVKNIGSEDIQNLNIDLNLGRSKLEKIETFNNSSYTIDSINRNRTKILLSKLSEDEVVSVYCLLSTPSFKTINISGDNLNYNKEYTYEDFIENELSEQDDDGSFFLSFLKFILGCILFVFALFFISIVYNLLYKWKLIDWNSE